MDFFKQGMKGPIRPAPAVPAKSVNRYSPVTNWNDDPFGADVFEPTPLYLQKKKPPPRPPPPKVLKQPDVPVKPSHFIRKPTVLTSLLSRKNKTVITHPSSQPQDNHQANASDFAELDTHKMFPKCERVMVQTVSLIDLSSPPSSPTFTTRSSSDGVSVDSFGSDATTSTNHQSATNGGNASQAESGFEDDFELIIQSKKSIHKEDTLDDFGAIDPFSPLPVANKPPIMKKPVFSLSKDSMDSGSYYSSVPLKGPTIIRAKPARPKPPENSSLLKNSFGSDFQLTTMNVNTTTPIHKIGNGFGDSFDSKPLSWNDNSPEREYSPPMPSIPPPPPPPVLDDDLPVVWPDDAPEDFALPGGTVPELRPESEQHTTDTEPFAVALYDYFTDHPDDLNFSANTRIKLIRRVDEEWFLGSVRGGAQGLFPSSYVQVRLPLGPARAATALYDFAPDQPGDLRFSLGDKITVLSKINEQWYYGECNGIKGQFPLNYVQMS